MVVMRLRQRLWKVTIFFKQVINMKVPIYYLSKISGLTGGHILISTFGDDGERYTRNNKYVKVDR